MSGQGCSSPRTLPALRSPANFRAAMTEGSNTKRQRYVIEGERGEGRDERDDGNENGRCGWLEWGWQWRWLGGGGQLWMDRCALCCCTQSGASLGRARISSSSPSILVFSHAFSLVLSISLHTRACPRQDAAQDSDCLGQDCALDVVAIANSFDVPADTAMHGNVELIACSGSLAV